MKEGKETMRLSKKVKIELFILLIILNLILRFPVVYHEIGPDSFEMHILANSLTEFGEARWWIHPLSVIGMYPNSYASMISFLLSGISQCTGLDVELIIFIYGLVFGLFSIFASYILAGSIYNNDLFKFLVAFSFSVSPGILTYTTWMANARSPFIILLPLFLYAFIRSRESHLRFGLIAIAFAMLLLATHHLVFYLIPVVAGCLLVTFVYMLKKNAKIVENLLKKYLSQEQIARVKTGPEYVILRDEILELKGQGRHDLHIPLNIVVTTGGTDPEGVLLNLIPWLNEMDLEANILILVGQAFKFQDELGYLVDNLPDNFKIIPYSLQDLIKGDIIICTFGVSIYEMIYLQIPTICISHNLENAYGARILKERYGVIENIGYIKDINPQNLYVAITKLLIDKVYYKNMVKRCNNLIDGEGAKRVGRIIVGGE